jgi:hypothetical protein
MKPRAVVLSAALVFGLLAVPLGADAQQPAKVPTIGYLVQFSGAAGPPSGNMKAFLDGLADLGYVDGKTIAIEYIYTIDSGGRPWLSKGQISEDGKKIVIEEGAKQRVTLTR